MGVPGEVGGEGDVTVLRIVPAEPMCVAHERRGDVLVRAYASGDFEVYGQVEDGPDGVLYHDDPPLTMTQAEIENLTTALGMARWKCREAQRRASGEAAYRVTKKGDTVQVTHDRETFPLRRSRFRKSRWGRECSACGASDLRAGWVVVHEPYMGPRNWSHAVICDGCVERQLEATPTLRAVK